MNSISMYVNLIFGSLALYFFIVSIYLGIKHWQLAEEFDLNLKQFDTATHSKAQPKPLFGSFYERGSAMKSLHAVMDTKLAELPLELQEKYENLSLLERKCYQKGKLLLLCWLVLVISWVF